MLGPPTFRVPAEALREQAAACDVLLAHLDADRNATLECLFRVLQEAGYCRDCGPEVIIRLGIKPSGDPPVPVLDLRTPGAQGWAGLYGPFLAGCGPVRYCGHFVTRNYASEGTEWFTRDEFFDAVEEHETYHVLQAMSGRESDLMTAEEMALCKGHAGLLPGLAAQGKLSPDHAFELAGRWFLQHLKFELEAHQAVDFPRAAEKASEGKLHLDWWRKVMFAVILRELLSRLCRGFLDTYRLSWHRFVASVRTRLEALLAGTFLEEPVPCPKGPFTPLSFLESIHPRRGLLRYLGGDPEAFLQLTLYMPRVGLDAIYDPGQPDVAELLPQAWTPPC